MFTIIIIIIKLKKNQMKLGESKMLRGARPTKLMKIVNCVFNMIAKT